MAWHVRRAGFGISDVSVLVCQTFRVGDFRRFGVGVSGYRVRGSFGFQFGVWGISEVVVLAWFVRRAGFGISDVSVLVFQTFRFWYFRHFGFGISDVSFLVVHTHRVGEFRV